MMQAERWNTQVPLVRRGALTDKQPQKHIHTPFDRAIRNKLHFVLLVLLPVLDLTMMPSAELRESGQDQSDRVHR